VSIKQRFIERQANPDYLREPTLSKFKLMMKILLYMVTLTTASLATFAFAQSPTASEQLVVRSGSLPSVQGHEQNFTGRVRVDPVFTPNMHAAYGTAYVSFEPGARSAWHVHPAGQRLVVTSGVGRTGTWGGPTIEIRAGDAIWCPPGVKHWHGAVPNSPMTHLALTGQQDGKSVIWMEKVSDEQYGAP
jgi:quercetin dioxygenase-like cupin family protein